jgi:hypothetical protein
MCREANNVQEQKILAVTKLEIKLDKFLTEKKKEMLYRPKAREEIEHVLHKYMLDLDTIGMFATVGMTTEYTALLNKFNKILDGDLT